MEKLIVTKIVEVIDHATTGEKMRALRMKAGFSLRALGERMHVSPAYLSDLELGRRGWTEKRANEYAAALK